MTDEANDHPGKARRRLLGALAATAIAPAARAQAPEAYPSRPVRLVLPFAAAGALDNVARTMAQALSDRLGQPCVVENKPGAANVIANDFVAKSPPDGHTLLFAAAPFALNTALGMKLPYDPFADFAPISLVTSIPVLFVAHPSTPYRSLKDFVDAARATPGGLNYGTAGVGSMPHLLGEALRAATGAPMTHVGYKGAAPALQDVLANVIPMMIDAYIPTGVQVAQGRLRGLAIASERRSPLLPDVPTTVEQGHPSLVGSGFYGLLAPAKTPPAIVERLHSVVVDAVNRTDIRERLQRQGYDVHASTPAEYAAYVRREIERWTPIVKAAGIKPQ